MAYKIIIVVVVVINHPNLARSSIPMVLSNFEQNVVVVETVGWWLNEGQRAAAASEWHLNEMEKKNEKNE